MQLLLGFLILFPFCNRRNEVHRETNKICLLKLNDIVKQIFAEILLLFFANYNLE